MLTFAETSFLGSSPTPAPSVTPSCTKNSEVCQFIFQQTKMAWLAESSYWALVKPIRILLIIALALLVRHLAHRAINRLIRHTVDASSPSLLNPLRERIPSPLREAAAVASERRHQRAATLGSVLRNIASATVFAVASMLVLAELSVDLAPILASAGIAGLAIGFGAQNLVKDLLAGLFILLEDQYGVGDVIDTSTVSGTVEAVSLRITTVRDEQGAVWYIRNGEILRVGNKSQGWALVNVDVPVGLETVQPTTEVLRRVASELAEDPDWADDLVDAPEVLGVEQITNDGAALRASLRASVKTTSDAQWRVGRELRRRITEALQAVETATGDPAEDTVAAGNPVSDGGTTGHSTRDTGATGKAAPVSGDSPNGTAGEGKPEGKPSAIGTRGGSG